MGTNFTHVTTANKCECCGRSDTKERHIGKSSGGWCFSLHVYPEEGINTLEDWKKIFGSGEIRNEYGGVITVDRMLSTITERSWDRVVKWSEADLKRNHAVEGPNGLVRSVVDGRHCIGHGDGTWDYIVGDFS